MKETEMGYRGSKSSLENKFVKEQRADGNWYPSKRYLRCALMGLEISYQIRILSKQLNLKNLFFSTVSGKSFQLRACATLILLQDFAMVNQVFKYQLLQIKALN
jgi:hypothetical protein